MASVASTSTQVDPDAENSPLKRRPLTSRGRPRKHFRYLQDEPQSQSQLCSAAQGDDAGLQAQGTPLDPLASAEGGLVWPGVAGQSNASSADGVRNEGNTAGTLPSPVQSSGQPEAVATPSEAQPRRGRRNKVSKACIYCKRSHMTCDDERPCQRCKKRGIAAMCTDKDPAPTNAGPSASSSSRNGAPQQARSASVSSSVSSGMGESGQGSAVPFRPPLLPRETASADDTLRTSGSEPLMPSPSQHALGGPPFPGTQAEAEFAQMLLPPDSPWSGPNGPGTDFANFNPSSIPSGIITPLTNFWKEQEHRLQLQRAMQGYSSNGGPTLVGASPPDHGQLRTPAANALSPFPPRTSVAQPSSVSTTSDASPEPHQAPGSLPQPGASPNLAISQRHYGNSSPISQATLPMHQNGRSIRPWERQSCSTAASNDGAVQDDDNEEHVPDIRPYWYGYGYAKIQRWITSPKAKWSQNSIERVQRALEFVRPHFRGIHTSLSDIELVRHEQRFLELLAHFRDQVFESVTIPMLAMRRCGEMYAANSHFVQMTGIDAHWFEEGRTCFYELMSEQLSTKLFEGYMQIFRDGAANPLKCSGEILVDHTVPPFAGRGTGPPDGITRARVVVSFEPILDRFGLPIIIIGSFVPIDV